MTKLLQPKILLFIPILLFACGKSVPTLKDVDLRVWSEDKNGCLGKRASMESAIENQKTELLGLSEMQITNLLGLPDNNELYKRNQKFYYYFIQPSKDCATTSTENPHQLVIRFTAMGVANEISVE